MRLRHITGSEEIVASSPYVVNTKDEENKEDILKKLEKGKKIHIEIGMGKGKFITELALKNKDINYIGVEMYPTVMLKALKLREELLNKEILLDNLFYMNEDAKNLLEILGKKQVEKIYLNFSDPWPKGRHAKRRLTSPDFLKIYENLLTENGDIEFKTDNLGLFEYSVESFKENGWKTLAITYDLHDDKELSKDNIMTEYEEKFSKKGNPIFKLIASK